MQMNWLGYKKLLVAVIGAAVMAAYGYFDDSIITNLEWVQIASAGVGAYLVWLTANGPVGSFWRYSKTIAYSLTAVLAVLYTTLPDGLTSNEWFTIAIAGLTALGILATPNAPETRRVESF